jgi:carbamate kinase
VVRGAQGDWQGLQAVIDKDLSSALLARSLDIPDLLILTSVERVAIDFNTPRERRLDTVTLGELKRYQAAGHFGKGSMGPKIEAAIRHIEAGGRRAIIAALEGALPALKGETGTHVVPG